MLHIVRSLTGIYRFYHEMTNCYCGEFPSWYIVHDNISHLYPDHVNIFHKELYFPPPKNDNKVNLKMVKQNMNVNGCFCPTLTWLVEDLLGNGIYSSSGHEAGGDFSLTLIVMAAHIPVGWRAELLCNQR